jgi:hypothetical protein
MTGKESLNARQERFCQEYASDPKRNQTRAAVRAGYSDKSARINASVLMKNPNIRERIRELQREALEEAGYSPEALRPVIMRELLALAFTNAADVVEVVHVDDERRARALAQTADLDGGQYSLDFGDPLILIKSTRDWTPQERAAVKSVRQTRTKEGVSVEVGMYDKAAALKALAEIVGLSKQAVEVSGGGQPLALNLVFGAGTDDEQP